MPVSILTENGILNKIRLEFIIVEQIQYWQAIQMTLQKILYYMI